MQDSSRGGEGRLTARFEEALVFAARLHARQVRKVSGVPYVSHLLAVAALVLEDGAGEEEAVAALLHDAVEDQGGKAMREEIRRRFGEGVARIVDGCTDADTVPKPAWRGRKERFLASLGGAPAGVLRVVAADKLHNVRSLVREYRRLGEGLWGGFQGGREGTLWYYREAARILGERGGGGLAAELGRAVRELEGLAAGQG